MSESATGPSSPAAHAADVSPDQRASMRAALLQWYRRNRRELPWRGVDDPYAVWVSEVMLQQTQVSTVIDYYRRWMQRFPDVDALADADLEEVLEMWAGLGYYRRARFLHESARMVVDEMDGELPRTARTLEKLKGVGPYTAGAIASIAFGQAAPVVDGNVERVLSRLFVIAGDPKSSANQKIYWRLAEELVDPEAPGDFNQAMMELGATVCTPGGPACMLCPVREHCQGFAIGEPSNYPATASRARQRPMSVRTCVVVREVDGHTEFLVVKRPEDGLLAGLWEFPSLEVDADEPSAAALDDHLEDKLGIAVASRADDVELGEVVHHFSHIRMTIRAHATRLDGAVDDLGCGVTRPLKWVGRAELDQIAMSAAMQKVLALFVEQATY